MLAALAGIVISQFGIIIIDFDITISEFDIAINGFGYRDQPGGNRDQLFVDSMDSDLEVEPISYCTVVGSRRMAPRKKPCISR